MSHLVCPLCGLSVPLSKFNPESLDLDLRVVSFRGLGRGKGFEKQDEHSILDDDEYSPVVAGRVLELCRMFIESDVLSREEVSEKLGLMTDSSAISNQEHLEEIKHLKGELDSLNLIRRQEVESYQEQVNQALALTEAAEASYRNVVAELKKLQEEATTTQKVNYILSQGKKLLDRSHVKMDDSPLYVEVDENTPEFIIFLQALLPELNSGLRKGVLDRVRVRDDSVKLLLESLSRLPGLMAVQEKLLEFQSRDNLQGFIYGGLEPELSDDYIHALVEKAMKAANS
jgi:hypothetical protein